mgnify:CR=1 FL=1
MIVYTAEISRFWLILSSQDHSLQIQKKAMFPGLTSNAYEGMYSSLPFFQSHSLEAFFPVLPNIGKHDQETFWLETWLEKLSFLVFSLLENNGYN